MDNQVTLTREELHAFVWGEPLSRLAKRYGMSDYGIRQLCIRFSIPIPRRDYWKKLRAGQLVEAPPLPAKYRGEGSVHLTLRTAKTNASVPSLLSERLDPLIFAAKSTLKCFDKQRLHNGLAWTDGKQLDIRVAPSSIERACRFMDQFLRTVRSRGYTFFFRENQTWLNIGKEPLPIVCREKTKRVMPPPSRYSFVTTILVPSGVLTLQMTYRFKEMEWKIRDGSLPDEASTILDKLEAANLRVDERRRELERGWAKQREVERIRQEQEDRRKAELKGFKDLLQAATRWRQTMWVREYLMVMEQTNLPTGDSSSDHRAWLAWARAKADWYDPLIEAPDEWLAEVNRDILG
ncbi:MAG TPA: hypothetical protein VNS58_13940 [Puia sp.]|nr:hypothetical protein [Puia sp.]